jgi:hypothetical protein
MRSATPIAKRSVAASTIERRTRITVSTTRARDAALSSMKTLQKFSSVHGQVHNRFNQERDLVTRSVYKQRRSAEWSALAA